MTAPTPDLPELSEPFYVDGFRPVPGVADNGERFGTRLWRVRTLPTLPVRPNTVEGAGTLAAVGVTVTARTDITPAAPPVKSAPNARPYGRHSVTAPETTSTTSRGLTVFGNGPPCVGAPQIANRRADQLSRQARRHGVCRRYRDPVGNLPDEFGVTRPQRNAGSARRPTRTCGVSSPSPPVAPHTPSERALSPTQQQGTPMVD